MKKLLKSFVPPILLPTIRRLSNLHSLRRRVSGDSQNLSMYWDTEFAKTLDVWGEGNAWNEIQLIMFGLEGNVLDIACGTGKVTEILSKYASLNLYGCDISDFLIQKAKDRNIPRSQFEVCDATKLPFQNDFFNYAYSIGSIEHFTEDGIYQLLSECYRVVENGCFHQHPISRSGRNEGWITNTQSYHNNSVTWWLEKYHAVYKNVLVLDSCWECDTSIGKWFICQK